MTDNLRSVTKAISKEMARSKYCIDKQRCNIVMIYDFWLDCHKREQ